MKANLNKYFIKPNQYNKTKKVNNDNFKLINDFNWENIQETNYKLTQLKIIAKKYKIKRSGNKDILRKNIINHLRLNFYITKIQKLWKLFLRKKYNLLKGPALINRKCVNSNDFLSLKDLNEVTYNQFFSYKDTDNFIYGFTIKSFHNLIKRQQNLTNPYNRSKITNEIIYNFRKSLIIGKYLNEKSDIKIDFNNGILSKKKRVELMAVNLFSKMDMSGFITHSKWLMELNNTMVIKFLKELQDVWNYRLQISLSQKRQIVPPHGNPFVGISFSFLQNEVCNTYIKKKALNVIDKLLNSSNNIEMEKLATIYILGSLTIVSKEASENLPSLYEAFKHN